MGKHLDKLCYIIVAEIVETSAARYLKFNVAIINQEVNIDIGDTAQF